jgi:iron complex transport system ATP-binding protein
MKTRNAYLTTANLTIGYTNKQQENRLFENLNLSLYGGQMICFMGPNGVGKSSLLRTLAGLQKPLSGRIELYPPPGSENSARQIAVVLTDRVNAVNLTVEEIVTFGRYPYLGWNICLNNTDRKVINASIEQIQLKPLLHKKLYELSDGQLQMVMIARALAQDTPIILLDEPTAHLDLNNRVEIMNLLRKLSRTTDKAILVATHELDLALQTADLIWLTGKNHNILTGLPEDLVLNGSFDKIFEFKGFDLKTGRVQHQPFRQKQIQLLGEGAEYLWTKNALERNGFQITQDKHEISIAVYQDPGHLQWIIKKNNVEAQADSIESLMKLL